MSKPNFSSVWSRFPDHDRYPTLTSLFTQIGGQLQRNINSPGFGPGGNTCATRLSFAFNYSGAPISADIVRALKLNPLVGADERLYLFRVSEFRRYLERTLGASPAKATSSFDTAFSGRRGIVAFTVKGWSDASGHIALWDGTQFRESHDDYRNLKDDPNTPDTEATLTKLELWPL